MIYRLLGNFTHFPSCWLWCMAPSVKQKRESFESFCVTNCMKILKTPFSWFIAVFPPLFSPPHHHHHHPLTPSEMHFLGHFSSLVTQMEKSCGFSFMTFSTSWQTTSPECVRYSNITQYHKRYWVNILFAHSNFFQCSGVASHVHLQGPSQGPAKPIPRPRPWRVSAFLRSVRLQVGTGYLMHCLSVMLINLSLAGGCIWGEDSMVFEIFFTD